MTIVNTAIGAFFTAVMMPFRSLPSGVGLTAVSLLSGLLFLWLFKKTSNQKAIKKVRDDMRASILEIRLFQHDLGVVFGAQGRILLQTAVYLRHSLAPLIFICVPLILIAIHCNLYFGMRPLRAGEAAIVSARLTSEADASSGNISLDAPPGVAVETPPVRLRSLNRVEWRVRPEKTGFYRLKVKIGDSIIEKRLVAETGKRLTRLSSVRPSRGFLRQLSNPSENPIENGSQVESVRVNYPPRGDAFFGWRVHWLIPFFILTLVFGYAFKGLMGVEI